MTKKQIGFAFYYIFTIFRSNISQTLTKQNIACFEEFHEDEIEVPSDTF